MLSEVRRQDDVAVDPAPAQREVERQLGQVLAARVGAADLAVGVAREAAVDQAEAGDRLRGPSSHGQRAGLGGGRIERPRRGAGPQRKAAPARHHRAEHAVADRPEELARAAVAEDDDRGVRGRHEDELRRHAGLAPPW